MNDGIIIIKDLMASIAKNVRDRLNCTDEQMLLGVRGALLQLEEECKQEWERHQQFIRGVEAAGKIMRTNS